MKISQPTPEIPVRNVEEAQRFYRDRMGFQIEWHHRSGGIGAVSHGDCVIFFRESGEELHSGVFWVFTEDIENAYSEFSQLGAEIVEPIDDKPWGLRQFTVQDLHGNIFHFHHDI